MHRLTQAMGQEKLESEMTQVTGDGSKTHMWEQKKRTLNFRVFL